RRHRSTDCGTEGERPLGNQCGRQPEGHGRPQGGGEGDGYIYKGGLRGGSKGGQGCKERSSQTKRCAEAINEEARKSPDGAERVRRSGCSHVAVRRAETVRRAVATSIFVARCHRGFLPGFRELVAGQFGC